MFNRIVAAAACCLLAFVGAAPALAGGIATTTTLTGGPASVGVPVTITATITRAPPAACTGTVNFVQLPATALVCTGGNPAAVAGNVATCQTTFVAAGTPSLTGAYSSTNPATCNSSTSAPFVLTVAGVAPTLGQWGMLALVGGLMIAGVAMMARRSRTAPGA